MSHNPYLQVTIGDLERQVSGLTGWFQRSARIGLPTEFTTRDLRTGQADFEILASKLAENPEAMAALLNAFVSGENAEVERRVGELRLRESDFQDQGGGIFWAVVIVSVLCCASEAR